MNKPMGTATIAPELAEGSRWAPVEGEEVGELLRRTFPDDEAAREKLARSSREILSCCAEPGGPRSGEAGLVIGHVQSGKTLSFTTVAAMARDNGYAMVILFGGTSQYLVDQTEKRLRQDLDLDRSRTWFHVSKPRGDQQEQRKTIQDRLDEWVDEDCDLEDRRTIVLTVMKHAGNLNKLANLLEGLRFPPTPVLIIDDEADQASLDGNAGNPKKTEKTATYRAIMRVREAVASRASYTFLQYTATPQAPLLIEIEDALSPSFVQILHPGPAYVGGRHLFVESPGAHLRRIAGGEMEGATETGSPPPSLHEALASFLVGIAADDATCYAKEADVNRSMLVHTSRLVGDHSQSTEWVELARERWLEVLAEGEGEEHELLLDQLRTAHADLSRTIEGFPEFDEVQLHLKRALKKARVLTLNQGAPPVQWNQDFAFILIGGQALERGFTVEGLTTTHMARSRGQGLADTIQQRARFFGYRRGYLGRIRIWLEHVTEGDFRHYVTHEEDVRRRLEAVVDVGRPLQEWKRHFLLDKSMRPTRKNVLGRSIKQRQLADAWLAFDRPAIHGEDLEVNRTVVETIRAAHSFDLDEGHEARTEEQKHQVSAPIPLADLMSYLAELRLPDAEQRDALYGAMLQLDDLAERQGDDAPSYAYLMSEGSGRPRIRRIDPVTGQVSQLFQGANYRGKVTTYPGDRGIKVADAPTLQIHMLDGRDDPAIRNVPAFALWIPARCAVGTVVLSEEG